MATYAIVGTGSATKQALRESLHDLSLDDNDTLLLSWSGTPVPSSLAFIYDYVLDNQINFVLYYTEGQRVPGDFREVDFGSVTKVRDSFQSQLKQEPDTVLLLWDDEDAEQIIYDTFDAGIKRVLELSNGLAPIDLEEVDDEAPAPAPVEEEEDDDDDDDEEDDDTRFTKQQLEDMAVPAVKRYGERMGCKAKTKSGIIEELFGAEEPEEAPAPAEDDIEDDIKDLPAPPTGTRSGDNSFEHELITLIGNFYEHYKPGFESDMAHLALGQARLWMLKMLADG
jgi:hypothetical protein